MLDTHDKLKRLKARLRAMESVLVAYSGGVDSTFLLKVAYDTLGDQVLAVLAVSPSIPAYEREEAKDVAQHIGARLVVLEKHELDDPRFVENTPDRCYFCKTGICDALDTLRVCLSFNRSARSGMVEDV